MLVQSGCAIHIPAVAVASVVRDSGQYLFTQGMLFFSGDMHSCMPGCYSSGSHHGVSCLSHHVITFCLLIASVQLCRLGCANHIHSSKCYILCSWSFHKYFYYIASLASMMLMCIHMPASHRVGLLVLWGTHAVPIGYNRWHHFSLVIVRQVVHFIFILGAANY